MGHPHLWIERPGGQEKTSMAKEVFIYLCYFYHQEVQDAGSLGHQTKKNVKVDSSFFSFIYLFLCGVGKLMRQQQPKSLKKTKKTKKKQEPYILQFTESYPQKNQCCKEKNSNDFLKILNISCNTLSISWKIENRVLNTLKNNKLRFCSLKNLTQTTN